MFQRLFHILRIINVHDTRSSDRISLHCHDAGGTGAVLEGGWAFGHAWRAWLGRRRVRRAPGIRFSSEDHDLAWRGVRGALRRGEFIVPSDRREPAQCRPKWAGSDARCAAGSSGRSTPLSTGRARQCRRSARNGTGQPG